MGFMQPAINNKLVFLQAAVLGLVTSFIFFPGLMSFDSIYQYLLPLPAKT